MFMNSNVFSIEMPVFGNEGFAGKVMETVRKTFDFFSFMAQSFNPMNIFTMFSNVVQRTVAKTFH